MSYRNPRRSLLGLSLALGGMFGCAAPPTDTGFVGTWGRGEKGRARAEISIWTEGETVRFRVNRYGPEGTHDLRCGREGPCLEFSGDVPYYEYEYRVTRSEGKEVLFVECDGRPLNDSTTPIQWIERYVVVPGGLALEAWRVETNRQPIASPRVRARYTKISDDPFL